MISGVESTARKLSFTAARQNVASVAHSRGVELTRNGAVVRTMEAVEFCRLVKAAFDGAGSRRLQVEATMRTLSGGIKPGEPLRVPVSVVNILRGFSNTGRSDGR